MKKLVLFFICFWAVLSAANFNDNIIARLDGKEIVSKRYFKDIKDRITNDPVKAYIRKLDFKKNFNSQILRIIAENYIIWKEAKRLGLHHRKKFKARFLASLQGYFAEYITSHLVAAGVINKKERFTREKLNKYLIDTYKIRASTRATNIDHIFDIKRKSPNLELYKKLPKAEFVPYEKFRKKEAEKYKDIISYRVPAPPGEKPTKKNTKRVSMNLRQILERLPDYDYYKFKTSSSFERDRMLERIICGDLTPVEFKRLSYKDKGAVEYVRRVEQITLARWFRLVRGIDYSSNYVLTEKEKMREPVNISIKEMREYFKKNINKFKRPRTANVWMLRISKEEVEEGDEFLEIIKEVEDPYQAAQKKKYDLEDEHGLLIPSLPYIKNKAKKRKVQKKINLLEVQINKITEKMNRLAKEIPLKKFDLFKQKTNELNSRANRRNGTIKKSGSIGLVRFSVKNKMKRYESLAFTVSNTIFKGKESILFNTKEGDYAILFVQNSLKFTPTFNDSMVQRKIREDLELKKRKLIVRKFINRRMKVVLKKSNVNWPLLRKQ